MIFIKNKLQFIYLVYLLLILFTAFSQIQGSVLWHVDHKYHYLKMFHVLGAYTFTLHTPPQISITCQLHQQLSSCPSKVRPRLILLNLFRQDNNSTSNLCLLYIILIHFPGIQDLIDKYAIWQIAFDWCICCEEDELSKFVNFLLMLIHKADF